LLDSFFRGLWWIDFLPGWLSSAAVRYHGTAAQRATAGVVMYCCGWGRDIHNSEVSLQSIVWMLRVICALKIFEVIIWS
jgi:hypothetical protein